MSRPVGSRNKTPSKKDLMEQIDQKALPPSFGRLDTLIVAPLRITNNPIELLKLNKGYVGICNQKNATSIASTSLRLFAIKNNKNEKIIFPHKCLNSKEIENIKSESHNLIVKQAVDLVEITEHPVFSVLNNVNDDLNYYDLMELTSSYLGMIGNAFWKIRKDKSGLPEGIDVLPAEYTSVKLDDEMHIQGYRLFNGVYDKEFRKEDVIHFKNISPGLFWRVWNNALVTGLYGMGDAEYVLDEIYLYNSVNDYLRALTENNSIPSGVIKYTGGRLDKNTMEDVQKQWDKVMRTWKRAGKTKVMDQDFDWQPLSLPPKDMDFREGRQWLRATISNAFGVPEDLVSSQNSNRASSSTAIHAYMRYTVLPKLRRLEERLNSRLLPYYDSNLFLQFNSPVPNDEAIALKQEQQDLEFGVLTVNEVRAKRGLSEVSWGNQPFAPQKETIRNSETGGTDNNPLNPENRPLAERGPEEESVPDMSEGI